jgi:hypothetical protein
VAVEAGSACIYGVMVTEGGLSGGEVIVLALPAAGVDGLGGSAEVIPVDKVDVVHTFNGKFVLILQKVAEKAFFNDSLQHLINLPSFLHVLGLLYLIEGEFLMGVVIVHGYALAVGDVDLTPLILTLHANYIAIYII